VRLLLPDCQVNQQPGRDVKVVHNPQRSRINLRRPVVPHEISQPGSANPQPHQNAPLQIRGGQFLRITPQEPRHHRTEQRPQIEPGKRRMLRHRTGFHQAFIAHLPDGKTDIRRLHQQQADDEMLADVVVTNNRRPRHRQQCAQRITDADFAATDQVINQRNVQRRHHRKQQEFRHRQVQIRLKTDEIHDPKLHRTHGHIQQNGGELMAFPAQEWQENQRRQP